jgi:hypothetical protein
MPSTVVDRARGLDMAGTFDEQHRMQEDLDPWVRLLRAFPTRFVAKATTIVWNHERNTSARRPDFPEELRRAVRKNELASEGS